MMLSPYNGLKNTKPSDHGLKPLKSSQNKAFLLLSHVRCVINNTKVTSWPVLLISGTTSGGDSQCSLQTLLPPQTCP
jgi:hypothetical protein